MKNNEENKNVTSIGNKSEEVRLKILKIEELKDKSYEFKINAIFWALLSSLEFIIRYTTSDKKIASLVPISIVPLIAFLFVKIRTDRKVHNLEKEILNSKEQINALEEEIMIK